ncbi:DUF2523 family protein [Neisseria meningitidis]|uniref:DUF2523 family protein n=1 Tax=Neisseria meningitidis TaxID=487 RepID=UPI000A6CD5BA|nr:DUF2523 family protein [Neisseria meningitidis]
MPRLIVALFSALAPMLKDLFFKILAGLGVSIVSYEALSLSTDAILKYFQNAYGNIPPDILNMFALARHSRSTKHHIRRFLVLVRHMVFPTAF